MIQKKFKYQKIQTNRKKVHSLSNKINFLKPKTNFIYLYSTNYGFLTDNHITIIIKTIKEGSKKKSTIFSPIFTNHSRTRKPVGSRIGKGKSSVSFYDYQVKPGSILCFANISSKNAEIIKKLKKKLPFKTKVFQAKNFYLYL